VERRQPKFLQSDTVRLIIIVECHVEAVVGIVVFIQGPTTYHLQTVERDVVHVARHDQHVPCNLADVS